jgi:hypothetical protein
VTLGRRRYLKSRALKEGNRYRQAIGFVVAALVFTWKVLTAIP